MFDQVSKFFVLNSERALLASHVRRLFRKSEQRDRFYALKNVSFRIAPGETVAIIGANGAGKSTMLSLIARLCSPDSGLVAVNGRVAALLQLGAGFHPDLTGVENVHMNAALLGLSEKETEERFKEIVEFSGIESFIDQPIRTYSSGMVMRLAFSIAVNVDPDILIVDEVLGVGDAAFQAKCLDRMMNFRRSGKTIVFVSHSIASVREFCRRAIWLQRGEIAMDGGVEEVLAAYSNPAQHRGAAREGPVHSAQGA